MAYQPTADAAGHAGTGAVRDSGSPVSASHDSAAGLTGVLRDYLREKRKALEDARLLALVGAGAGYAIGANTANTFFPPPASAGSPLGAASLPRIVGAGALRMPLPAVLGVLGALVGGAATSWYYAGRAGWVFDREYFEGELGLPQDMVSPPRTGRRRLGVGAGAVAAAPQHHA